MANFTAAPMELPVLEFLRLDMEEWATWQYIAHTAFVWVGLVGICYTMWDGVRSKEFLQQGKPFRFGNIPNGGPILTDDLLQYRDFLWTGINMFVLTPIYTLHLVRYLSTSHGISWYPLPPLSMPLQLLAVLCIYDAVYVPLHGMAHWPALYKWVHKHHHRQNSPFRGTWDGLNVNPIEYLTGTYLHLVSLMIMEFCMLTLGTSMHWSVPALLFLISLAMASLNHSRHDVRLLAPFFFDVRDHSVHHAWPQSNYGQFTMWWDRVWGSYLSYEEFKNRKTRGSVRRSFDLSSSKPASSSESIS